MGVPDSSTRRLQARLSSALLVSVASFFRRCASSQISRSLQKRQATWIRDTTAGSGI